MDGMLWQLVWVNLVTPNFPFIFPLRMATTASAVSVLPWWSVLFIANLCGGLGMLPVYAIARWRAADAWHARIEEDETIRRLRHRWRSNMFIIQVLMNATPLPDLVSSGFAGCERFSIWRFLLSQVIGRSFHNLPLVLGGLFLERFSWFSSVVRIARHPLSIVGAIIIAVGLWLFHTRRKAKQPIAF